MRNFFTETGKLDNNLIREKIISQAKKLNLPIRLSFVDQIIDEFWFHDFYNHFVADKVYFDFLLKYLEKNKFKEFNRFDYYSFLFNKIVKKSERENFQKLALFFEKQQTDRLKPSEFKKLIKKLSLPVKEYGIEALEKRHLIKIEKVEEIEYFIWKHHSLTEFLVAEYLLKKENTVKELIKLAVLEHEGVTAFKPSWSGVLRFLLESSEKNNVLDWLLTFLEQYPDNFDDNLGELITFIINKPDNKTKSRIFNLIYQYHFDELNWISVWIRNNLYKFIDKDSYKRLKIDIKKWKNKTETFVRRGNVVAIIDGMLKNNSLFINGEEKKFWKKTFIKFAIKPDDDGNGVLQRHCLKALGNYKDDEKVLKKIASVKLFDSSDSLVRDAFISLCGSMINFNIAIDYLIEGMKKGSYIYARHGLYLIKTKTSFKYFFTKISKDEQFLKAFLKHEKIFDKEEGDWQLLEMAKSLKGKTNLNLLKKVFFSFIKIEDFHHIENSEFIKQLVIIIRDQDKNFLFELIDQINLDDTDKTSRDFYDLKGIFALLLTPQNLNLYIKQTKKYSEKISRWAFNSIYVAKRINGKIGEMVYQKAIKLKHIQEIDTQPNKWEQRDKQIKEDRLKEFKRLLEPKPGKYFLDVFKYYLQNEKEFDEFFKTKDGVKAKKRLIKLIITEILEKVNPRDFKVKLSESKSSSQFTWSLLASYYGDVLEIANLFDLPTDKYRQQIIDFIPYCFSPSEVLNLIEDINDKDLIWVNKVMGDINNDKRYLIPGTYIYLLKEYSERGSKLTKASKTLLSIAKDKDIQDHQRISAIETLSIILNKSNSKERKDIIELRPKVKDVGLITAIDDLLIKVYQEKKAISRRFRKLRKPIKHDRRKIAGVVHTPSSGELEISYFAFAKPLIELNNEKYSQDFFKLLGYSFAALKELKTTKEKQGYWEYINYLWRIVIKFVDGLKSSGSFKPFLELEEQIEKYEGYENVNWLKHRIKELRKSYINEIGILKN